MIRLAEKKHQYFTGIIHFIGIGGIGMSGIAEILHNLGYQVQGSDYSPNDNTKRLNNLGIKIFSEHKAKNVHNAEYVVVSSAIKSNNSEVIEALGLHIPIISRTEMLAELMRFKNSIAISGSHGKTTTTSLVACIFEAANLLPTVINGGIINNKLTNAYLGQSEYLIAEADESDATFIHIPANIAVITNISQEHLEFYQDFTGLLKAFRQFINNLPFYGFAVVCIDHPIVRELTKENLRRRIITYGIESEDANIKALNIVCHSTNSTFDLRVKLPHMKGNIIIEQINLPIPGYHNVLNSLAALSIAAELNFGVKVIQNAFRKFQGVKRRFTKVGEFNGCAIIDDYAHHPVEIKATLNTAKLALQNTNGRIIAVFQPHRYSRLQKLFAEFIHCFDLADKVYLLEVYSAGETPIKDINSQELLKGINNYNPSLQPEYVDSVETLAIKLRSIIKEEDLILCMGAGNITQWSNKLAEE